MTDDSDKRQHHRSLAHLDVRVLPGEHIPADLKLATIDIAVGGARCGSNRPLEKKTRLQMTFTLEGGDLREPTPIDADASVLRCIENPAAPENRRFEVALVFLRMDPQDKRRLQSYLNSL